MVSCLLTVEQLFGNGSDSHVGYAYFAPTIIKTYGYGSTFCSTYLSSLFFAKNLTLSLRIRNTIVLNSTMGSRILLFHVHRICFR